VNPGVGRPETLLKKIPAGKGSKGGEKRDLLGMRAQAPDPTPGPPTDPCGTTKPATEQKQKFETSGTFHHVQDLRWLVFHGGKKNPEGGD